jgi:hypothetical protein
MIKKIVKKPIQVEAIHFLDNESGSEILKWVAGSDNAPDCRIMYADEQAFAFDIGTLEGTMRGGLGWWIIKGIKGEFYPCAPDVFEESYDIKDGEA